MNRPKRRAALVVGLGRFGSALADQLTELDWDVVGVERDPKLVAKYSDVFTLVVEGDSSDMSVMKQLGAADFDFAVVAIGIDLEQSVLSTALLSELGVKVIWAKALSQEHGRILEKVGASRVVYPEAEMGRLTALSLHALD